MKGSSSLKISFLVIIFPFQINYFFFDKTDAKKLQTGYLSSFFNFFSVFNKPQKIFEPL
jgi:hypothetical protein